jgi:hypothetical protein
MAIKMTQDDSKGSEKQNYSNKSRRSGTNSQPGGGLPGGGGLGSILQLALPFLLKNPKLLILALVIGVLFFIFKGKFGGDGSMNLDNIGQLFSTGGKFDKEIYEEVEMFEPLADNRKNPLPERVSLQQYCPQPLNQGEQGSCVAWAAAYSARTILEAQRTGKNPDEIAFSPAFMYNQISIDHNTCQGSYIKYAMDNLTDIGAVGFNEFKYNPKDCNKKPSAELKQKARSNTIKGFQRLTIEQKGKTYEMLAMKQNLAQGSPVIIGMMVGGSFMQAMEGKEVWIPNDSDYDQRGFGGHAMTVVGYDDYKEGGAFLIMNSWGKGWGKNGFCWVRYSDFKEFNVEAYGLYPMGFYNKKEEHVFRGEFGLQLNDGNKTIQLHQVNDFYFETVGNVKKGDRFKVEFTNNIECYTYIFGEDDDKSAEVLFPYTEKHSPYCGITGTRLFPRDYSMESNGIGATDKIAIVITKKPIDYVEYASKINKATGNFEEKMKAAFNYSSGIVRYSDAQNIKFNVDANKQDMVIFVIGVKK